LSTLQLQILTQILKKVSELNLIEFVAEFASEEFANSEAVGETKHVGCKFLQILKD
jgi:hypothetical protein